MSLTLEVQPETAARISELALEQGLSVDAYLRSLIGEPQDATAPRLFSSEEIRMFFDELTAHPSEDASSYKGIFARRYLL
jgi:hypothetical protein